MTDREAGKTTKKDRDRQIERKRKREGRHTEIKEIIRKERKRSDNNVLYYPVLYNL